MVWYDNHSIGDSSERRYMLTCKTGRVIQKKKGDGKNYYVLRLNFIDDEKEGIKKYKTKDITTNLKATKKNFTFAEELLKEQLSQYLTSDSTMYLSTFCDQWIESVRPRIESITFEGYTYRIRHIKRYAEENNLILSKISANDINNFCYWLLFDVEKKCTAQKSERGLSNHTVKDISALLKEILDDAVLQGLITENPYIHIKRIPTKPEQKKNRPYISVNELDVFYNAIKDHRLEIPYIFALHFGLRREELAGLKWSAVRNGRLYIEHTVTHLKTTQIKDRTKTDSSCRDYPINSTISDLLDRVKRQQEINHSLLGDKYVDSGYIFTWENGEPYRPDYLTKQFKKIILNTPELDNGLTLHSLRASCVSILAHQGVDIKDIQDWVGHSDIATTMNVYARVNEDEKKKVAQTMSSALFDTRKNA